ncbi:MAG: hypothetical protein QXP60_07570 [Nitrososphaerota archaeon]
MLKNLLAKVLSIIFSPPTFSSLLVLIATINEETIFPKMHTFLIGLIALTIAPYLSVIFMALLKKDNIGVPERKNRTFHLIYGLINYSFFCILFSLIGIKNLALFSLTYLINTLLITIANQYMKPSIHVSGCIGPMILLNYLYKIDFYYLVFFLFLIAWARMYLKKHTSKEIIIAAIITIIGTIISITLFY